MRTSLTNVGPIKSARIDLLPFIIFVGPNNSGKSFAATAIHALLSRAAVNETVVGFASSSLRQNSISDKLDEPSYETFMADTAQDYSQVSEVLRGFFSETLANELQFYGRQLVTELERVTGADLKDLRRIRGTRRTTGMIHLEFERPVWSMTIVIDPKKIRIDTTPPDLQSLWGSIGKPGWRRVQQRVNRAVHDSDRQLVLIREVASELFRTCVREIPSSTRYLPAARSGLMQSHKVLSGSLIRQASLAGIRPMNIPAMSGIVTEFLSELVQLDPDWVGSYDEYADKIERDLLHGHIQVDESNKDSTEVLYETSSGTFPLSRTSSMVSELAPIVLYLRNIVEADEVLFIEEPEAHIHPAAQLVLARLLVELVNAGLRVGLTTHSEFFLQQLNNSMLAGSVGGANATDSGYPEHERLDADSVAAYRFEQTTDGTVVDRLKADASGGVSGSSFDEVSERLYDEMVVLEEHATHES